MSRLATNRDTPLSVAEITHTALALADREGIDALSMRRLAAELNVSTMALYHHFSNKAELIQAITSEIWLEAFGLVDYELTDPVELIVSACVAIRRAFSHHAEFALYAVATPSGSEMMDQVMAASASVFRQTGLPEEDIPFAYETVSTFTLGTAILAARRRQVDASLISASVASPHHGLPGPRAVEGANDPLRHELRKVLDAGQSHASFERGLRALLAGLLAPSSS